MDIIAFTLAQFKDEVPTRSHLIQTAWRPYFHKLDKADRPAFTAMIDYADAYHHLKDGNLRSLNIKGSYDKLVGKFGHVNPNLPIELDIDILKNMYSELKAKADADLRDLITERQVLIDDEMSHIRSTLKALNKRLKNKDLSYEIVQKNWTDHIAILDEKTNKTHTGEI